MRKKPWARPELEACPYYLNHPTAHSGAMRSLYARPKQPLHLELGCGKGDFLAGLAPLSPGVNYLAIDIKSEVLAVARRSIQRAYAEVGRPVDNLLLCSYEIALIDTLLTPPDFIDRVYINFCNPWPRAPYHKKRLTHPRQLMQYASFLHDGAEIWFKTDDDALFSDSLTYFADCGFSPTHLTHNYHACPPPLPAMPPSEHEQMFVAQGVPIKFCVQRFTKSTVLPRFKALRERGEYQLDRVHTPQRLAATPYAQGAARNRAEE